MLFERKKQLWKTQQDIEPASFNISASCQSPLFIITTDPTTITIPRISHTESGW